MAVGDGDAVAVGLSVRLAEALGLAVALGLSEVMGPGEVALVESYADVLQVGARNVQNFVLLKELGLARKPVLLKRGMMTTLEELLMSAEYILAEGNEEVILCERGIRTFETAMRNTLDLSAVPVLKDKTHLPVIVDPSHAIGQWRFRPNNDQSNPFFLSYINQPLYIVRADIQVIGYFTCTSITRRGIDLFNLWTLGQLPDEGVFPGPTSNNKYLQNSSSSFNLLFATLHSTTLPSIRFIIRRS